MFLDERKITELKYGVTFLVSGSGFEICHVLLKGHPSLVEYFFQLMPCIFVSDKTSNYYKSKKEFTSCGRRENSSSWEQGTVQFQGTCLYRIFVFL